MSSIHVNVHPKHKKNLEYAHQLQELSNFVLESFSIQTILTYLNYLEELTSVVPNRQSESLITIKQELKTIRAKIKLLFKDKKDIEQDLVDIDSFSLKLLCKHFRNNPQILEYISKYLLMQSSLTLNLPKDVLIPLQQLLEFEDSDVEIRIQILYNLNLINNNQPLDFLELRCLPENAIRAIAQISKLKLSDNSPYHQTTIDNSYQLVVSALQQTPEYLKESKEMLSFASENLDAPVSATKSKPQELEPTFDTSPPTLALNSDAEQDSANPFQHESTRVLDPKSILRSTAPKAANDFSESEPTRKPQQLFDSVL